MIRFRDVSKHYPRVGTALTDVSFHIRRGEFVFLTGPSGAGKTTVLRLIHMEITPSQGDVQTSRFSSNRIRRREIPLLRRSVGFVFQDFRLLERLTAEENVAFALEVTGASRSEIKPKVHRLLGHVGLAARARSYPTELSGGERQRVAIARALATGPLVLLADEPTGNLDERASVGVCELFRQLNGLGTAVVLATHDVTLLRRYPDVRVLELEDGHLVYDSGSDAAARPPRPSSEESPLFEIVDEGKPSQRPGEGASTVPEASPTSAAPPAASARPAADRSGGPEKPAGERRPKGVGPVERRSEA